MYDLKLIFAALEDYERDKEDYDGTKEEYVEEWLDDYYRAKEQFIEDYEDNPMTQAGWAFEDACAMRYMER